MIIGGVVFAIASSVKASDADEQLAVLLQKEDATPCFMASPDPACEPVRSSLAASDTLGNLSIWSFVVGGSLGAATAIYALAAPKAKAQSAVRAVPLASADTGGIMLVGRF